MVNKSGLEFNHTHRDGLFDGRMLHVFMCESDRVPIAVRTHMINSLGAVRTIMQLYRGHSGGTLLNLEQQSPKLDVPEEGWTDIPFLDGVATLSQDGRKLFLHLLNLHPSDTMELRVEISGGGVESQREIWQVAPDDFEARNDFEATNVEIRHLPLAGVASSYTCTLPAHSATIMEVALRSAR